ncbi:MAG: Rne/Rng family ribonuclease [Gammaproteobacteria bacterium]|nr:Rne/Rng family ribonuclease [Gammaproteobacteria bacterium]MYE50655.1 Rne/Rng family ribonuclease [Gammaproteobacteria bacterium]MYF50868.1 Rne/Rng family ribonuclease [Gammaproteobacteria bacterium]
MKRMLINATQPEELRVALVDGQKLYDLDIENRRRERKQGNVYKAKVIRIEPSLEAAFVDFGPEKRGFLPLKDIAPQNFDASKSTTEGGRKQIQDLLKEGQELIVQVEKEERGTKGAAVTTFVSLAGRYMVLMPTDPRAGGVSRRVSVRDRSELRETLADLDIPAGMGVIIRTAGVGRSVEELQWDLDYLLNLWKAIVDASETESAPKLLYAENNLILRAIRDYLGKDIGELTIDNQAAYDEAISFVDQVMPNYRQRVKFYDEAIPLFTRYQIESQIASAFNRTVKLPSGGSVVFDPTEALMAVDINSARATKGADIEETALTTNLEAAEEVARQLRLRDVGGLIVIDFIDMSSTENQKTVENTMRNALQPDRARVQIGRISQFGLMQMSRQRLRPSLEELTTEVCPRCSGQGRIQDVKSLALAILRIVEEESLKERSSKIRALVPLNVAAFLLNEKRTEVADIERRSQTHIVIVPNVNMETPQYEVQRIRDDHEVDDLNVPSYELTDSTVASADEPTFSDVSNTSEQPAVQAVRPPAPTVQGAPSAERAGAQKTGLISKLVSSLFSDGDGSPSKQAAEQPSESKPKPAPKPKGRKQAKDGDGKKAKGSGSKRGGKGGRASAKDAKPKSEDRQGERKAKRRNGERQPKRRDREQDAAAGEPQAPQDAADKNDDRKGQDRQGHQKKQADQPVAAPAEETAARVPDEEALAQSKRRPRRNRGKIAEEARQGDGGHKRSEPAEAEVAATDQAVATPRPEQPQPPAQPSRAEQDAGPSPAPVKAADPEPASDGASSEAASNEAAANDSAPKPAPSRALNDPRVMRRQQQEEALKTSG